MPWLERWLMLHSIQEHAPKEKRGIWLASGSNGAQYVAQTLLLGQCQDYFVWLLRKQAPERNSAMTSHEKQKSTHIDRRDDVNPDEGEHKYGDVQFADSTNNKYPVD